MGTQVCPGEAEGCSACPVMAAMCPNPWEMQVKSQIAGECGLHTEILRGGKNMNYKERLEKLVFFRLEKA